MSQKEWSPRRMSGRELVPVLVKLLDEGIEMQRATTGYEGPDEGWASFVANQVWPAEIYQRIGVGDGFLRGVLAVAHSVNAPLSQALITRSHRFIYRLD